MVSPKISFSFFKMSILASAAAAALTAGAPTVAQAGTAAPVQSVSALQTGVATDISAARRRHTAHRGSASARAAFGSIVDGPVYASPSHGGGYPGFGYGYGDNSRQTSF
jgi:hypothetical protein